MKKNNFFNLVFWVVLVVVLFVISMTAKAEDFAKYIKNFYIYKSTVVNIRTNTAGYLNYRLKRGMYEIDIKEVTESTIMLDDGVESAGTRYDPVLIEPYHYRFKIYSKREIKLKQGFKTSSKVAKFRITIKKIGD